MISKTLLATTLLLSSTLAGNTTTKVHSSFDTGSAATNIYEVLNSKWTNVTLITDYIAGA